MKNMKFWRTALVATLVLTVMLSVTGGTIAWFTDSVTSEVNTITAGNLDVELYYQLNSQTDWKKVDASTNVFKTDTLWEPGHTEVVKLKIVNEGSLALKYNLGVNIDSETGSVNVAGQNFLLSDFIKFGIVDGAQNYSREQAVAAVDATATALKTANNSNFKELLPKTDDNTAEDAYTDIVTMVVYMPTTVGNEANHAADTAQPIINLGLNLIATQFTYEPDSFDNKYDKIGGISGGRIEDAGSRWQIAADFAATGVKTLAVNVVDINGNIITTVTPETFEIPEDGVIGNPADGSQYSWVTTCAVVTGNSSSWQNTAFVPTVDAVPATMELVINGVVVDVCEITGGDLWNDAIEAYYSANN